MTIAPIFLVDAQEFRRIAYANVLSSLLSDRDVILLHRNSVAAVEHSLASRELAGGSLPLFILNAGHEGLNSSELRADIGRLRSLVPDCPVLVIVEAIWDGDIRLASSLEINGVISTWMPTRNALAAVDVALSCGTYFPRVVKNIETSTANHAILPNAEKPPSQDAAVSISIKPASPKSDSDRAVQERLRSVDLTAGLDEFGILKLSRRQQDVLQTIQAGMSNKEIARSLGLSEATVKIHVRHLMRKFGAGNRTQVAIISRTNGLAPSRSH